MNKMYTLDAGIISPIGEIMDEISTNGTYFPAIDRVIFSLGDKKIKDKDGKIIETRACLTTTVFFIDGTKSIVQNSAHDGIVFNDDQTVSDVSKEAGVVYAIVKRLFGRLAPNTLTVDGAGFGGFLRKIVNSAYDSSTAAKKAAEAKKRRQEEHLARQAAEQAKAAKKKPSLAKTVERLAKIIDEKWPEVKNDEATATLLNEAKTVASKAKKPASKKPAKKSK